MSKNNKSQMTEKELAAVLNEALQTEAGEKVLLAAMDRLFANGKWEIPDDAVAGLVKNKVDQLDAQVKSLTARMVEMSGASAVIPGGRVDAIAASKATSKGKK